MKGKVIKQYACPHCGAGVKLIRPDTYVRCPCGTIAMFGNPEDPAVVCNYPIGSLTCTHVIVPFPDDYKYVSKGKGGVIYANPKRGKMVGVTQEQMDLIMPMAVFAKYMGWDSAKLLKACDACIEYDAVLASDL
jgi:hypothetical protein